MLNIYINVFRSKWMQLLIDTYTIQYNISFTIKIRMFYNTGEEMKTKYKNMAEVIFCNMGDSMSYFIK